MSQVILVRPPASMHLRIFLGASLLSATGSLPMHLMPLIIATIVADGKVSIAEAGWLASTRVIGELLVAVMLPIIGAAHLGRASIAIGSASLLLAILAAASGSFAVIVVSFFIIGACSGSLKFAGTMSAASYYNRSFAFLFRLALVLGLAGTTICFLFAARAYASYETFLHKFAFWMLPVLACGGLLYRPATPTQPSCANNRHAFPASGVAGLLVVYLFFLGISGFMSFVAQQALSRGLSLQELVLGFGAMKLVTGVWLFIAAYCPWRGSAPVIGSFEAAGVVAAIWIVYSQHHDGAVPCRFAASGDHLERDIGPSASARGRDGASIHQVVEQRHPPGIRLGTCGERFRHSTGNRGSICHAEHCDSDVAFVLAAVGARLNSQRANRSAGIRAAETQSPSAPAPGCIDMRSSRARSFHYRR